MITTEDRAKYQNFTDSSILGIKLIGGLENTVLLSIKEEETSSPYFDSIKQLMGAKTNHRWILGRIIDEMFEREIIGEEEYYTLQSKYS